MNEKEDQLKGWKFQAEEISANVYRVRGNDQAGRSVERKGTEPELVLAKCKADAMRVTADSMDP